MNIKRIGVGEYLNLQKIIKKRVLHRNDFLITKIKNKEILDIGCIGHKLDNFNSENSLHNFLKNNSKKVLGMDYMRDEVNILRNEGHNIVYGNAESFKLNPKFDVIIAGELIEHLNNPGEFLQSTKNALSKNGSIIITTPNAFSLRNLVFSIFLVDPPVNEEHTMYFDPMTLKRLAKNNGLEIHDSAYTFIHTSKFLLYIEYLISFIKLSFSPTIIFELKKIQ